MKKELGDFTEWYPKTRDEWQAKKDELCHLCPLITLPYIKSGGTVVTRPQAIMMALCMKANRMDLLGKSIDDAIELRALESNIEELKNFAISCTLMAREELKKKYADTFSSKLTNIVSILSIYLSNKQFLIGDLTIVDFELAHVIELYGWLSNAAGVPNPFLTHANLMNLVKSIKNLPGVSEYVTSPEERSMKWVQPGYCRFESQ